jgi:hypothetical protein
LRCYTVGTVGISEFLPFPSFKAVGSRYIAITKATDAIDWTTRSINQVMCPSMFVGVVLNTDLVNEAVVVVFISRTV